MSDLFRRYATPFITGLFVVSLVSGLALFFHVGQAAFRGMHEWLSLVLILPFGLHLWKNWRAMMNYVGRLPFSVASVLSVVAALAFAWPAITGTAPSRSGPPQFAFAEKMLAAAPKDLAPALGLSADAMVKLLNGSGYTAASANTALRDIAAASSKSTADMMVLLAK